MKDPQPAGDFPPGPQPRSPVRNTAAVLMLLGASTLSAFADEQDAPQPEQPAERSAPEALDLDEDLTAIKGMRYKVLLTSGRSFRGVARGPLYVRRVSGGYDECKPEDKGAGVRLWFPLAQRGFVVISITRI